MRIPTLRQAIDAAMLVFIGLVVYNIVTTVSRRYGGPLGRRVAEVADSATGL